MKKIAIVINGPQLPAQAFGYALSIARHMNATVFGLFVCQTGQGSESEDRLPQGERPSHVTAALSYGEAGTGDWQSAVSEFAEKCEAAGVMFKTHRLFEHHLEALLDHTAFSDIMICDSDFSPASYSRNSLLANAHCPVLLINKDFKQVDCVVLTYDDKISGIHAIKFFSYLFSAYSKLPAHFVTVVHENVTGLEYRDLIEEWLPLHFPNARVEVLRGSIATELPAFISNLTNPLVVMGAFGRSSLSRFLKESLANVILEKTSAPVFIAHN